MKNGINYHEEYKTVLRIQKLLDKARDLGNSLPDDVQFELSQYHSGNATLTHCTRWGLQAAEEMLEDWQKITAELQQNGNAKL
ncbi:MAG: hypothetical protein LBI42_12795 [Chitinispirillales bacterium]|jgi:hypothetical protein|nr:hypothetical protein [Chitinispirillales bacterium]